MKKFFMKKMLKSQLKGQDIPEKEIDRLIETVEKNPELFQKIAAEIQEETGKGRDQETVMIEVMEKYQSDLRDLQ